MQEPLETSHRAQTTSSHRVPGQALVVVAPEPMSGQTFALEKDELSIGRADGNDVRLENPFVSRRHAVVRRAGTALVIEDAGSTEGLTINGVRAAGPALLRTGDRIRIGEVELELVGWVGPAAAPRSTAHPSEARFDVDAQRAEAIHNVAGNQYSNSIGNQYNVASLRVLEPMRRRAPCTSSVHGSAPQAPV